MQTEHEQITTSGSQRKYHKTIEIPLEAGIDSILDLAILLAYWKSFSIKKNVKPKGKEVKVE
ncbi:MAG: hypothetical protein P0116_15350 [Candidatus Nitrosocosmicus sp.]|nr:hypothetical protein [Candidatus Nitrosocosmicus sp.]